MDVYAALAQAKTGEKVTRTHLEWAAMYLKGIATCIRVYSYDGLHKPGTIREVKFIDLRCE